MKVSPLMACWQTRTCQVLCVRILVLGASGLVGRETVLAALRRGHVVVAVGGTRSPRVPKGTESISTDLTDAPGVERLILDRFPDAVINAAAIATIADCEKDPKRAEQVNSALPRRLAQLCHHVGARFIHLSTDMVFDGEQGRYRSTDLPLPLHLYGQTKLLGEVGVLSEGKKQACVLRTTLVSANSATGDRGLHERLFLDWKAGKHTSLFTEEIRQPVSATNLADVCVELCERESLSGLFHWAGSDAMSRYEMGVRIAEHFGLNPAEHIKPVAYTDIPNLGKRPRDLSFELHPLVGKLRTRAQAFSEILGELEVPMGCDAWYTEKTGRRIVRRLAQGIDF